MKNNQIEFYRKNVYGRELIYLANEQDAKFFKQIARRETLVMEDLMGFVNWADMELKEILPPKHE